MGSRLKSPDEHLPGKCALPRTAAPYATPKTAQVWRRMVPPSVATARREADLGDGEEELPTLAESALLIGPPGRSASAAA